MALSWNELFAVGALVDFTAGFWSGQVRLKVQDLGIPNTPEIRDALNMAHIRLVKKDHIDDLRKIVQKARGLIENNSIPFTLVQGAAYIPVSRREELEARLRQLKIEFDASVGLFILEYDELREEMEPIIRKAISDAAIGNPDAGVERVLGMYPPKEVIRHKFHFSWHSFAMSAPLDGAIAGEIEKSAGQVTDAVKSMVSSLRDRVVKKISEIIDLIVRGGKYSAKTINSARRAIQNARKLNILNDSMLERTLTQFESVLVSYNGDNHNTESFELIRDRLQTNLDQAVEEATDRLMSFGKRKVRI